MSNKLFTLTFDPDTSASYPHGYWYAYAEPGYDGAGETPESAMAALIVQMARELTREKNELPIQQKA